MQTNRVVVITGAAGGIGSALVARFLANDDTVVATDINEEALGTLSSQPDGPQLIRIRVDLARPEDVQHLAEHLRSQVGRVDVLINCAGYFPYQPFEQLSVDDWRKVIDINLTGAFLMTQAVLPLMKAQHWGRIISFGSGAAFVGAAGQTHYVAAKAGIVGFSRSLAREVGQYGITVNVVTPGFTLTERNRHLAPPEVLDMVRKQRALKRDETPQDLVGAVFFLASPDADFITAQTLNVDGGINAH